MKSYREELWFETKTRRAFINITPQVEAALKKSGIREGLCLVNAMHISAWEQIFYGEFDGKRKKRVLVKMIGE